MIMKTEILANDWRPLIFRGMKTNYIINSYGQVADKFTKKIKVSTSNHSGYIRIMLYIKGKNYNAPIHRLVAEAFIPNDDPENKTVVNHIDANRRNNHVSNLEWTTPARNKELAWRHGVEMGSFTNQLDRSDTATAKMICDLLAAGHTREEVARVVGLPLSIIEAIKSGTRFPEISAPYNFKKLSKEEMDKRAAVTNKTIEILNLDTTFPEDFIEYNPELGHDPLDDSVEYWSKLLQIGKGRLSTFRVSNHGRVMNERRETILIPKISDTEYLRIGLYHPDEQKSKYITLHRLVAEQFVNNPEPDRLKEVAFLDGDTFNCKASNLIWISKADRMLGKYEGLVNNGTSKLTEEEVRAICELIVENQLSNKEIAEKFGVRPTTIQGIRYKNKWKSISDEYDFPDIYRYKKENFGKVYPQIDSLILQGFSNKDVIRKFFVIMKKEEESKIKEVIAKRRKFLIDKGLLKKKINQ